MSQWDCYAPDEADEFEFDESAVGMVVVPGLDMGTIYLEPGEAREFAAALLACADHAESRTVR